MKNVLSLLADWANGFFAVVIAAWWLGVEPVWWHFLVGIAFSHSPDLDAIPELLKRGKVSASAEHPHDHRAGLHYPVLLFALGGVAAAVFPYWGLVFLLAIVFHLVNDFYGTGWGIKLLWPVSQKNYKLLGRRVNQLKYLLEPEWSNLPESERRLRLLVAWQPEELPDYMRN